MRWLDACRRDGMFTRDDVTTKGLDRVELHSAGVLVLETKETLTIAESYDPTDDTFRDLIHIPTNMIEYVERFKPNPVPKRKR